uniref:Ark n=1 Tax=Arundo donax TaxID=35708 RepID=A0A0A8YAA5_ARUDO
MAIPAMAPPESLLLFLPLSPTFPPLPPPLPLGTGVGDAGCPAGAGEGEASPGQGPKGPPHKPIPRNAERGMDRSPDGMDPFSWLNETLNCCSCGSLISGISPTNRLFSRSRDLRFVRLPSAAGMGPDRSFPPSASLTSPGSARIACGNSPDSRFPLRKTFLSAAAEARSAGRAPESPLRRRLSVWSAVRFPSVPAGTWPESDAPGSRSTATRPPSQVTPVHEHAPPMSVPFHGRRRPTASRNASSARASSARSAPTRTASAATSRSNRGSAEWRRRRGRHGIASARARADRSEGGGGGWGAE